MHKANTAMAAGVMLAELDSLVRPLPSLLDGLSKVDCNSYARSAARKCWKPANWSGARAIPSPVST